MTAEGEAERAGAVDADALPGAPEAEPAIRSDERPQEPGTPAARPALPTSPYDPTRDRETKRGEIAMMLIYLLVAIAVAPYVLLLLPALCIALGGVETCKALPAIPLADLLGTLLTPVVGLVGAVAGFYFGEKKG